MRKLTHHEIAAQRLSVGDVLSAERPPLYALLDNIRSLYNVGSIFRSADGALVRKLFLTGYTPTPPRPEIDKTALGATKTVPWEHHPDPQDAVRLIRAQGIKICVLEQTTESRPYFSMERSAFPLCLVVGNELTGVSEELVEQADFAIDIPMIGTKQSLNAAVAFGIAVYGLLHLCSPPSLNGSGRRKE